MIRRTAIVLLAAGTTVPSVAGAAPAGNVEVVSRAWGVAGASPFTLLGDETRATPPLIAGAVSDDGRFAAFSYSRDGRPAEGPEPTEVPLYLRDVLLNRTIEIASTGYSEATAIDRNGRYLSYESGAELDPRNGPTTALYVYDIRTGRRTLVSRASGADGAVATNVKGRISGDGRSVVFIAFGDGALAPGVYRRALSSAVTTRIGDVPRANYGQGLYFQRVTGLSDDGLTVALATFASGEPGEGVLISPQRTITVPGVPGLSGDGRTAAYLSRVPSGETELNVVDVAAGTTRTYPGPDRDGGSPVNDATVGWISPSGREIALTVRTPANQNAGPGPDSARLFDRSSRRWTVAGPFAGAITRYTFGPFQTAASSISRNGRFAVITATGYAPPRFNVAPEPRGLFVVDTHGWNGLPGGADLPSPNFYVNRSGLQQPQGVPVDRFSAQLAPRWLPKATSVRGVVRFGDRVALDETVTSDGTIDVPVPDDATSVSLAVTVTFPGGRSVSDTYRWTYDRTPTG